MGRALKWRSEGRWDPKGPQIKSQILGYPQILQVVRTRPQKCHLSRAEALRRPGGHQALSPGHISQWPKFIGDGHKNQPRESAAVTASAGWWHLGTKIASPCGIEALCTSWLTAGPASSVPVPVPTPQAAPVPHGDLWKLEEMSEDGFPNLQQHHQDGRVP